MGDVSVLLEPKTGLEGIPFEAILKAERVEDEAGDWIVEGFAATSDLDLQGDIIKPEALDMAAETAVGLTVLHNHNPDQEIGKVVDARAVQGRNGQGRLWVRVEISKDEPKLWGKIKQGIINKFSIRGKILSAHRRYDREAGREANVVEGFILLEVSLVAVPANPEAKTLRAYVKKALEEFVKSGGVIPVVEDTSGGGGRTEEDFVVDKALYDLWLEHCAEKGLDHTVFDIADDVSEEDALKALDESMKAVAAAWEEFCEKQKAPYPYPYPYPKPAKKGALKDAVAKVRAALKMEKPDVEAALKALDALEKLAYPAPAKKDGAAEVDPKALELLDALISKASDDDKKLLAQIRQAVEALVSREEPDKDGDNPDPKEKAAEVEADPEPAKSEGKDEEVEALKEVAKQLNARMAELEKRAEGGDSGDKYTFEQVARIVAGVLQKQGK